MRTHTIFISFEKLTRTNGAGTVTTLALVCNDLAIANPSMGHYNAMTSPPLGHIRRGGRMYFSRMMCGHLFEGISAIGNVSRDASLRIFVSRCSDQAQQAFQNLCECLPGGKEHNQFKKYVGWMRNRVAFHYDLNDLEWAMRDRAKRAVADTAPLTAGEDIHSTRFEFGDDLLDSIVVRKLWRIARNKDVRIEADRIADWCNSKCVEFLQFSQEFVPLFLRDKALVS